VTSNTDSKTTQTIAQSGYGVTVNPNGLVSQPAVIPVSTLNTILNQLGPQGSSAGGTKEQQQIISALSADMLTGNGSVASKIGIENAVKLENAIVGAANTLAKSNNDALLISDLFKIINQNNDLKEIVSSITTANGPAPSWTGYENLTNVKVDVNLLPYFVAGPLVYMPQTTFMGKTGSIQFDYANIPLTTTNGGHGAGSGTLNTAQVLVNYDAKTFTTSYNMNYVLGGTSYSAVWSNTKSVTDNIFDTGSSVRSFNSGDTANNLILVQNTTGGSTTDLRFSIFSIGSIDQKAGGINVHAYDGASCSASNCVAAIGQGLGKPL